MIRIRLIATLICFAHVVGAQDSLQYYFTEARKARGINDTIAYYAHITAAHRVHPTHPTILYHAAIASAQLHKSDESSRYLRKLLMINANADLSIPEFRNVSNINELSSLQGDLRKEIIQSDTAFLINNKTLHIECIATGEDDKTFYLGSIHQRKIIRRDKNGNVTDFTPSGHDGLTAVFGIKIDRKKNILWAASSPIPEIINYTGKEISGLFKFDLKSGKLLARYTPDTIESKEHIFGDLTLDNKGRPFISDSKNNIIFTLNDASGKLEPFFSSTEFKNLQGIAFNKDNTALFIADYVKGVYKVDVTSRNLMRLKENFEQSTKSIDGLTFYNNGLIAIQNSIRPMRVTRYDVDEKSNALGDFEIIDRAHPAFNEPTIGCVSGDYFYYIANSQWGGYTDQHTLKDETQLQPVVVLKYKLK
ncbi:MAG TPA: hypothetical protein VD927_02835 [Chryseosolibacter sp.]|nr:hypothetical protein [Chryseosolibacter sp.]